MRFRLPLPIRKRCGLQWFTYSMCVIHCIGVVFSLARAKRANARGGDIPYTVCVCNAVGAAQITRRHTTSFSPRPCLRTSLFPPLLVFNTNGLTISSYFSTAQRNDLRSSRLGPQEIAVTSHRLRGPAGGYLFSNKTIERKRRVLFHGERGGRGVPNNAYLAGQAGGRAWYGLDTILAENSKSQQKVPIRPLCDAL